MTLNNSADDLANDFEDFFEGSLNGFVTTTPDGRIMRANARMCSWLGYDAGELSAMRVADLFGMGGKIYFETHLRPLLQLQGSFEEIALELRSRDGRKVDVLANASERRDGQGVPLFVRFTFTGAGDRRKYEQDLRDERLKAETGLIDEKATSALREQFIAVLGHDLRNPIASIDAGMRMLSKAPLDAKSQSIVDLTRASSARMAILIDDIMDFARGRLGGGIQLDRREVLLEPVVLHAVNELRQSNSARSIEANIDLPEAVWADPGRLAQVVSNLLANALTHGAADIPIRVTARQDALGLVLSVTNGGSSIPPDILKILFEPFTREKNSASQQGLGLGLYISSEIVRAHGGTLSATSTAAETKFTLSIPTYRPVERVFLAAPVTNKS